MDAVTCNRSLVFSTWTLFLMVGMLFHATMRDAYARQDVLRCQKYGTQFIGYGGDPKSACDAGFKKQFPNPDNKATACLVSDKYDRYPSNACVPYDEPQIKYKCPETIHFCSNDAYFARKGWSKHWIPIPTGNCPDSAEIDPDTGECGCPEGTFEKREQCVIAPTCGDSNSAVGNPCDAATGYKTQSETDYSVNGTGIDLTRYYNSAQKLDFGFGVGWAAGFSKRLLIDDDHLLIQHASGGQDPFTRAEGVWQGDPDADYMLVETYAQFTIELPDGDLEHYNADGLFLSESTAAGLTTTYQYDPQGKLTGIVGPYGHSMSLTYDDNGHITSANVPGKLAFTYSYDGANNLTKVEYPDGATRSYHYEDPVFPNALTGITDANGDRFSTYAYDSRGRAVSTEHARTDNGTPQQSFHLEYGQ